MAENLYFMGNGYSTISAFSATTSAGGPQAQTSGTAGDCSVLLQLATPSTRTVNLVEYGVSFTGSPAGARLWCVTSATGSTMSAAGLALPYTQAGLTTSQLTFSTTNCGYATGQVSQSAGTITAMFDQQLLTTNTYVKQFPLAREPVIPISSFLQIVVSVPTTSVTAFAYVVWRE